MSCEGFCCLINQTVVLRCLRLATILAAMITGRLAGRRHRFYYPTVSSDSEEALNISFCVWIFEDWMLFAMAVIYIINMG